MVLVAVIIGVVFERNIMGIDIGICPWVPFDDDI